MIILIFSTVLIITLVVGTLAGKKVKNVRDYYIAGGGTGAVLLTGTFLASNVSAALFLGATDVAAKTGYAFWCAYVPTSIGFLICLGYMGPAVRRLSRAREVFTFPDILCSRISSREKHIRLITALAIPVLYLPYVAAQLDGVASVLARIFKLDTLISSI